MLIILCAQWFHDKKTSIAIKLYLTVLTHLSVIQFATHCEISMHLVHWQSPSRVQIPQQSCIVAIEKLLSDEFTCCPAYASIQVVPPVFVCSLQLRVPVLLHHPLHVPPAPARSSCSTIPGELLIPQARCSWSSQTADTAHD